VALDWSARVQSYPWIRDESAERFPSVITPLAWDWVEDGFRQSLPHSFQLMGLSPFRGKWFALFDHYVYGNQNAVDIYAEALRVR
jgi:pyruvate,water dikinase